MKKEQLKEAARQASDQLDERADALLSRVIRSRYTWAIAVGVFVLGWAVGRFIR